MIGENEPTVRLDIKPAQLLVLARAIDLALHTQSAKHLFSDAEEEELELLKGCCEATAKNPGEPDCVHGFCF